MPRKTRRRKSVRRTPVSSQTFLNVSMYAGRADDALGRRVREAAEIIALGAKADAADYPSVQIPESIHVGQGSNTTAVVYANSPNARPIELGLKHKLFGEWVNGPQYFMKRRRFLENGAVANGDAAAATLALVLDDWAKIDGFK
jgi:hypothetical protein